jgi:hypothetical protein
VNLAVRVCRAKKGRCWDGYLYKVPVPLDNPVWYEWDERKKPSCNSGWSEYLER